MSRPKADSGYRMWPRTKVGWDSSRQRWKVGGNMVDMARMKSKQKAWDLEGSLASSQAVQTRGTPPWEDYQSHLPLLRREDAHVGALL